MLFRSHFRFSSVNQLLLWLMLACLVPGLLVAVVLLGYQHQQSRHELEQQTILTARAQAQSVDNYLFKMQATAQALSNSEALRQGDLAAFHREASQTLRQAGLGSNVVLRDRAGRQLLNTAREFGRVINVPPEPGQVEAVFATAAPTISNLFIGPVRKRPILSVDVPVVFQGDVIYALGVGLLPENLNALLSAQKLPAQWIVAVLDGKGVVVARTVQSERFVGQLAAPSLLRQLDLKSEGFAESVTLEGTPVVAFHSRSPTTGWTVAIGVPKDVFTQGLYKTSLFLALSVTLLFAVGAWLAWLISARIGGAFQALTVQAAGLVNASRAPLMPVHRVKEASEVADALKRAAVLLDEREATLKASEARFKAVVENMSQLAWLSDEQGRISWFNQRWYDYTGQKSGDGGQRGWLELVHPEHEARVRQEFEAQLRTGLPWEDTFPLRGKAGAQRWFLSRAMPLRDGDGRITNWFGTLTDVTPQLEAQQALQEAHVRKDGFIALLAHELRNPLAPVRTAVEILQRSGLHEPRLVRACKVIERQVTHMARLIDDLLDVARIATGKLVLQSQACDLSLIARDTTEDYQLSTETMGLALEIHTPPEPIWVIGDSVRLAQMIGNLLNNASRFTEPGGRIDVYVQADSALGEAVVRVVDTGVGISVELIEKLFVPFSQAAQDLARSKGGLGLGLALTQGLADLHGGTLRVESDGVGRGATFILRLPLAPATLGSAVSAAANSPKPQRRPLRVLIIEDNQDAAQTLAELLRLTGNEVELAFDGETALGMVQRFEPEVVVCDIGLPGMDGYAVARQLRSTPSLKGVYLVALSGYTDEQACIRGREAGFDRYLFKPVSLVELEDVLDEFGQLSDSS